MRSLLTKAACLTVFATASLVATAAPASAEPTSYEFVGLGDGTTWNDQMNWNPQGIPRFGDSVTIKQTPAGPSHVTEAPATQLATITIGAGGSLDGSPMVAASVSWTGGTIYNDLTVITALQVSGSDTKLLQGKPGDSQKGVITVLDKALITGDGELRANRGTIINKGEFLSVGAPGQVSYVNGNFGGPALGTFVNEGYVTAMAGTELHLENFALESPDSLGGGEPGLSGGTVRISGGTTHLPTNAKVDDHVILTKGNVVTADGVVSLFSGSTLDLDGSTSTTLSGSPNFTGTGVVRWLTGTVTAKVTVSSGVTMGVTGTGLKVLNNKVAGPMEVNPGALVLHGGSGALRLGVGAEIVNRGIWRVRDLDAVMGGATCCVAGSVGRFRNLGALEIQGGRTLTMGTASGVVGMDYSQENGSTVAAFGSAGGQLVLAGGDQHLNGGIITGTSVDLVGNGTATVTGTVNVHTGATMRQTDGTDLTATGTLGGAGRFRWSDGSITGQLVTGAALRVDIDDPASSGQNKVLSPSATKGGLLDVRGPLTIDTTKPVVLASTSSKVSALVLGGATAWRRGTLDYTGVAGTLRNTGSLTVAPGRSTRLTVVHDGRLKLSARGAVSVGSFRQGAAGRLTLLVAGRTDATRDRIVASGALQLGGRLTVKHQGTGRIKGYGLLTGSSRAGTFGKVVLRKLPGCAVAYKPASVVLTT